MNTTVEYHARYSDGRSYQVIYDPAQRKTHLATEDGGRMDVPYYINGATFQEYYFTGPPGISVQYAWKLRAQMDVAESAKASFVYSPAVYVHGGSLELASAPDPGSLTTSVLAGEAVPAGGSNVLVTTSAMRKVGGFDDGFVHLTDFDCWIRLGRVCRAARCEEPLVAYMQDPGVMHLRSAHRVLGDVRRLHQKYRSEYEVLGRGFDGEGFLVWIAHQHRATGRPLHAAWIYLVAALRYRPISNLARAAGVLSGDRGIATARRLLGRASDPDVGASSSSNTAETVEAALTWLAPYLPADVRAPEDRRSPAPARLR